LRPAARQKTLRFSLVHVKLESCGGCKSYVKRPLRFLANRYSGISAQGSDPAGRSAAWGIMLRLLIVVLAIAIIASGCAGASGPAKKVCYPVKGQLLVQGKPAEGALVILHPKDDPKSAEWSAGFPHGTTAADGKFELATYADNDGAPAGDYVVLVSWTTPNPQNEEATGPDKLGGRYADPATSKLTAKVEPRPTELPPINVQ
jgi:hypothetical protein